MNTFWATLKTDDPELPDEPYVDFTPERIHKPDMYLNQTELFESRCKRYNVTKEELDAVENAALAVIQYASTGYVKKTALAIIDEVTKDDGIRCVELLNVVLPLARSISEK